jgi:hypothetical protein
MDPNVTNRWVQGYSSALIRTDSGSPFIRRIFVRGLTPETHGNGTGIGLADVTTTRLVRGLDNRVTSINALTSLTPHTAKIPIHFDTDREAIERTLDSLALEDPKTARVVRIADTLSVIDFDISEALWPEASRNPRIQALGSWGHMAFGPDGNLT